MWPGAAVILAGGRGRRLGGADKPALVVGGRSLLQIALDAVGPVRTVVVGPPRPLPPGVLTAREEPPGSGPAAGVVAGLRALRPDPGTAVLLLAADQPGVTASLVDSLAAAVPAAARGRPRGVVAVDPGGRRQYLLGIFPAGPLWNRCLGRDWSGGRLGDLLDPLVGVELTVDADAAADIDTPADLARWQSPGAAPPAARTGGDHRSDPEDARGGT